MLRFPVLLLGVASLGIMAVPLSLPPSPMAPVKPSKKMYAGQRNGNGGVNMNALRPAGEGLLGDMIGREGANNGAGANNPNNMMALGQTYQMMPYVPMGNGGRGLSLAMPPTNAGGAPSAGYGPGGKGGNAGGFVNNGGPEALMMSKSAFNQISNIGMTVDANAMMNAAVNNANMDTANFNSITNNANMNTATNNAMMRSAMNNANLNAAVEMNAALSNARVNAAINEANRNMANINANMNVNTNAASNMNVNMNSIMNTPANNMMMEALLNNANTNSMNELNNAVNTANMNGALGNAMNNPQANNANFVNLNQMTLANANDAMMNALLNSINANNGANTNNNNLNFVDLAATSNVNNNGVTSVIEAAQGSSAPATVMMVPLMPDTALQGSSAGIPAGGVFNGEMVSLPGARMVGLAGGAGNAQMAVEGPGAMGAPAIGPDCYVDQGLCILVLFGLVLISMILALLMINVYSGDITSRHHVKLPT